MGKQLLLVIEGLAVPKLIHEIGILLRGIAAAKIAPAQLRRRHGIGISSAAACPIDAIHIIGLCGRIGREHGHEARGILGARFGGLHGHGLPLGAFQLAFLGDFFAPLGYFDLVGGPEAGFFVHVLFAELFRGFAPGFGEHFAQIGVGGVGVFALESGAAFVGEGQKGGHGAFGGRGILRSALVGWNLPGALVHGLFDFVTRLVFARFLFPIFLFFGRHFSPSFRNELGNIRRLYVKESGKWSEDSLTVRD